MTPTEMQSFWQINLGNVMTILCGVVSIVVVWQKMRDKVEEITGRQTKTEQEVGELTRMGIITTLNQHERRITMLETLAVEVSAIKADLGWIKDRLRDKAL